MTARKIHLRSVANHIEHSNVTKDLLSSSPPPPLEDHPNNTKNVVSEVWCHDKGGPMMEILAELVSAIMHWAWALQQSLL